MRCYLGRDGVDITARFRAGGKGPTVTAARVSVPLRYDDLVAILYHTRLVGPALSDADAIREAILDTVVNHGGAAIAADKARLAAAIEARDGVNWARLAVCQRRITDLYGYPDKLREHHEPPVIARPVVLRGDAA